MHDPRRSILILAMVCCLIDLPATTFRSNSIAMRFEEIDPADEDRYEYVLKIEQIDLHRSQYSLFHHGIVAYIRQEELHDENGTLVRMHEEWFSPSGELMETRSTLSRNDLPLSISYRLGSGDETSDILFEYHGYSIHGRIVSLGEKHYAVRYSRDPINGSLVAAYTTDSLGKEISAFELFGEMPEGWSYAYSTGDSIIQTLRTSSGETIGREWANGETLRYAEIETDSEGRLVSLEHSSGSTIRKIYNAQGLLVVEEVLVDGVVHRRSESTYTDAGLPNHVATKDFLLSKETQWWYDSGNITRIIESSDGKITKSIFIRTDLTRLVTLYDNGRPYADIEYHSDGKTVASVIYREIDK